MKIEVYTSKFINNRFSNIALLIFAFAFAGVGTYLVISGLAATKFTISTTATTTLVTPVVSYPSDGSIVVSRRPQLSWNVIAGANSYRVKIYQDDNLIIDDVAKTNSYAPPFDLTDGGSYYWSVQALNATIAMDTLSTVQLAATTTLPAIPTAPALRYPQTGAHLPDAQSVTVYWYASKGLYTPLSYVAECSPSAQYNTDGSFTRPLRTTTKSINTAGTFPAMSVGTYFWHVRAIDARGHLGPWSATRSFVMDKPVVAPSPAPTPTVPADVNVTINSLSQATFLYNFTTRFTATSDNLMPAANTKWAGAFVQGTGDGTAVYNTFETNSGYKHQLVNRFKSFYWDPNFPVAEAQAFYNTGHQYLLTWEPWNPGLGATQAQFSNAAITNNQTFTNYAGTVAKYDDYVKSYALAIKAYKKPVYIRFAHEMNGGWYPWGTANGNTPASYVAMWRHVHNIFDQNGVKNVRWVWCVNNSPASVISSYYPGDAYVDVLAADGYNWGNTQSWSTWTEFRGVFDGAYSALSSVSQKEIWIVEVGSKEAGGNKATWITNAFSYLKASYPRVRVASWFNADDWIVNSSTTSLAAYKAAVPTYK